MRIGSLFSGAAGLDMAVQAVFGGEIAWHCENAAAASKVLAYRYPDTPNYHDITAVEWAQAEPVDVLGAGWPCQPFSLAGKRKGIDDERALWPYVAGAVRALRPRYVVLENVSAVLRSPEFSRVADSLAACGYDFRWTCLRASDVGAPHRRERLFIIATDTRRGWLRGEFGQQHGANTERDSIGDARPEPARIVGGSDAALGGDRPVELLPTPCAQQSGNTPENHLAKKPGRKVVTDLAILVENGLLESGGALLPTPRTSDTNGAGLHGDGGMDLRTTISLLQTPSVADALGGHLTRSGTRGDEPLLPGQAREMATAWGKYEPAIRRWEQVTRPAPSPTELNTRGNPRLAPAFSEWMMGWPEGWITQVPGISRNDQLRIVGNGVVSQCAEAAIRYLLSVAEVAA